MKAGLYLCLFSSVLLLSACDKTEQPDTTTEAPSAIEVTQEAAPASEAQDATTGEAKSDMNEASPTEEEELEVDSAEEENAQEVVEQSEESSAEASELDNLQQYLEKYPHDGENFLTIPPLKERLATLLGDDLEAFLANLETTGPLSEEDGILYITGNKDNEGGQNEAALVIDPDQDALYVWLLKDGVAKEFKEAGKEVNLPSDVKTTQKNAASAS